MTLTRYLTQYVYTPIAPYIARRRRVHGLAINRKAQQTVRGFASMIALPIIVTMTLAGIWHGSGAQFLVFGLLHALYFCVNHVWRVARGISAARPSWMTKLAQVGITYLSVLVASVFFAHLPWIRLSRCWRAWPDCMDSDRVWWCRRPNS